MKFLFIFWMFFLLYCSHWNRTKNPISHYQISGSTMGTTFTVIFFSYAVRDVSYLKEHIEVILKNIENTFSLYITNSKLNLINQNHIIPLADKEVQVFKLAKEICKKTHAYFFPFKKGVLSQLKQNKKLLLRLVRTRDLSFLCDSFWIQVKPEYFWIQKKYKWLEFNFNAIAKGYAVDWIRDFLYQRGITSFLVEIGGEICVGDSPPNRKGWKIALENPNSDVTVRRINSIIYLKKTCIATSGNYFQKHIWDPYQILQLSPLKRNKYSISVIGPSCAIADAYATALFINRHLSLYSKSFYRIENSFVSQ